MNNVRRTLSRRLSRTIMILAIPLFVLALGVFYKNANRLLHREAVDKSRTILSTTTQLVVNYLNSVESAARSNLWMLEENFNPDSLAVNSRRIVSLNKSVLSCSVAAEPNSFPQYGEKFSVYTVNDSDTIISEFEPEFEYFEKNWYKKPMQTGKPCWITPFSDFNAGVINHHDAVGSFCMPIRPHGNKIEGVVSVDFSFKKLRETILATHHPYPSSYYMILGPVGGYLIHPDNSLLFKKTIFTATDSVAHPDIIALGREMIAHKHGTMHVTIDDVLCHVTYMPITDTGWSIALVCHDEDVLADYNNLTIVMIIIVIIGILIITWITKNVVQNNMRPLNKLLEATKIISEGNYATVIEVSKHKDSIGKLQNAFRKMQLAIMANMSELLLTKYDTDEEIKKLEQVLPLAEEAGKRRQIFIQNVSRQFITPLNIIEGLTHVLVNNIAARQKGNASQKQKDKDINEISDTLKYQSYHLLRNTHMLFDTSDTGADNSGRYAKTDDILCNKLARECIDFAQKLFSIEDIIFKTELPDNFSIRSNHLFVMRTIRELLYNAAKFSDGYITIHLSQTDTTVRFMIEDVGPGLPKNAEELIFVPFTKIDDLTEGLGLGLPLCKKHITCLGGNLLYDENYLQGCRFIVELPKQ